MGLVTVAAPIRNNHFNCDGEIRKQLRLDRGRHEITNREAIKVLNKIKRNSKIVSFVTKPTVAILTSLVTIGLGVGLHVASIMTAPIIPLAIALKVASMILIGAGSFLLAIAVRFSCNGVLSYLSRSHYNRSIDAQNYIIQLRQDPTLRLELQDLQPEFQA